MASEDFLGELSQPLTVAGHALALGLGISSSPYGLHDISSIGWSEGRSQLSQSQVRTNETVLLTGGSGFIGTHISKVLNKRYAVNILDTRKPSHDEYSGFIQGSVTNMEAVSQSMETCSKVVHLAGMVGVARTEANLLETLDVNILGTRNVLEACRLHRIERVVFSSSSEVYGEPLSLPMRESDSPRPITLYGVSKLAAEQYVSAFASTYGFKYSILRLFNVYGPGQSTQFVLPKFVHAALRGERLEVDGDGSQVRSFCYVDDVTNAVAKALEVGNNEILNIGNDREPIAIRALAEKVLALTGSKSGLSFRGQAQSGRMRMNEISRRIPSIEKARRTLGYDPAVSLDAGIRGMIEAEGVSVN